MNPQELRLLYDFHKSLHIVLFCLHTYSDLNCNHFNTFLENKLDFDSLACIYHIATDAFIYICLAWGK